MDDRRNSLRIFTILALLTLTKPQGVSDGSLNIFDALSTTLDCGKFKSIIQSGGKQTEALYKSTLQLTVFAPNNTAFLLAPADQRDRILGLRGMEATDYVKSFTISELLDSNTITPKLVKRSLGQYGNRLFFYRREARRGDITNSGAAGRTEYFVNGALIVKKDVRAANGIIHVIDRLLDQAIGKNAYGYIVKPNDQDPSQQTAFFREIVNYVAADDYETTVLPLQSESRITLFVPTDAAFAKIPREKLENLRGQPKYLARVVQQHFIKSEVLYMSFIYHNSAFASAHGTTVIFRKNTPREKYYVSSGKVTAEITGNLTVANGVVHFVDTVLGFVYNTAREEINLGADTREFEGLLNRGRKDLRDALVRPSGVTVFVPVNSAFTNVQNLPGVDLYNDQGLINMVLELQMLEQGTVFEVTLVNGDYDARMSTPSRYRGYQIKIYSQGNDTWAEGGYVKARVIQPDIGVTNGYVHHIDAIFGIPYRDVPNLINCEDWLLTTSYFLEITSINSLTRDTRINRVPPACYDSQYRRNFYIGRQNSSSSNTFSNRNTGSSNQQTRTYDNSWMGCGMTGQYCEFTMFVPNGTAMENFQYTQAGRIIMQDTARLQYVLRRHLVLGKKIYMDQLSDGYHSYVSHTNEEIRFRKIQNRFIEVYFMGNRANVIHTDLGATNGVIHIIDAVLYVPEDLSREIRSQGVLTAAVSSVLMSLIVVMVVLGVHPAHILS